ncbi:hypothetical protein [Micromonospora sp. NPDC004704]
MQSSNFEELLAVALPDGIDTIYDNVGASQFPVLLAHVNDNAQITVGGVMGQITTTDVPDVCPKSSGRSGPGRCAGVALPW